MRAPSDLPRRSRRLTRRGRAAILVGVVVVVLLLTSLRGLASFYTDFLWFRSVHFTSVFTGILATRIWLAVVFTLLFFGLMFLNLTVAERISGGSLHLVNDDELVQRYRDVLGPYSRWIRVATSLIFALFAGVGSNTQWNNWLLYRNSVPFGTKDAQFHKDVSFFVFKLPFIHFVLNWIFVAVIVTVIVCLVSHYLNGGVRVQTTGERVSPQVKAHISVLFGVLAIIKAIEYFYARYSIDLSTNHIVNGATYTEVHANLPANDLLAIIAVAAAVLFLINIRSKGWLIPAVAVALWALVWVLAGAVYPAVIQALRVAPSENVRERPYIARNIEATRLAYGLNTVVSKSFAGNNTLNPTDVTGPGATARANAATLANIRLLDPNFIKPTFDRLQAIRSYYQFPDLDVDRYNVNGKETESLLAIRELNQLEIPSGFVNQHLQYTHGYGAALSAANASGVAADGTPRFALSDIPPSGSPKVTQPDVYFGEQLSGYVIAKSKQPELDYEDAQNTTRSITYSGTGGVPLGSLFRRAAYALRFGDLSPLISGQVTPQSRIMYLRDINEMVHKAAPFLQYDSDPYATILNGRVYWIYDAYTTTSQYPYAQQADLTDMPGTSGLANGFNYVRNSVKVVIDAYNGSMRYYVRDASDPIIRTYEKAFPRLFTPISEANRYTPGLFQHLRYPEDLFRVQTNMYGRYHLTDPNAFYTQANAWTISQDPGSGSPGTQQGTQTIEPNGQLGAFKVKRMDPTYLLTDLPGEHTNSFLILRPFIPVSPSDKQQNLTAFMVAKSDPADYGQLEVYTTPPGANVDGPALINSAVESNQNISTEITFLNQQGSQVKFGNVIVVPIGQALLYVQPLYVQSSTNPVPKLGDVIIVYNGVAYHSGDASLQAALCKLPFGHSYCATSPAPSNSGGGNKAGGGSVTTVPPITGSGTVGSLLAQAQSEFTAATAALESGNLAQYQADIALAQTYVQQAQALAAGSTTPGTTTTTLPGSAVTTTTVPASGITVAPPVSVSAPPVPTSAPAPAPAGTPTTGSGATTTSVGGGAPVSTGSGPTA